MSSSLTAELENSRPGTPVHASKAHLHQTWAKTFHSRPELYIRPRSLEEIQTTITLARKCKRRLVLVGSGHSPSDLTCTSSWMVNLDFYNQVIKIDQVAKTMTVQAGIRLHELSAKARENGLTMPNLGSINEQSIAGAIATATHGSSLKHGLLSDSVLSLRIALANGSVVKCGPEENSDLFRAALVSLGALGIIVEVEYQMASHCNIEWDQSIDSLQSVLDSWEKDLWTKAEYTRVWWLPYMKRAIIWRATKTDKAERAAKSSWYGGLVGFHTYHILLWISNYFPRVLPQIEWFIFGMRYGFRNGPSNSAIEEIQRGLLMDCLYSQFVNEWAIPLHKGPEAITRLSAWLHGDEETAQIPFSSKNLWVHAPVEVRVSDTSSRTIRPFLDNTVSDGPTLYLNATLYRPYHKDPPCHARYYEAFEWLMKELGGKPHWAKNFAQVSRSDLAAMYGSDLASYLRVRHEVDPDGMFVGEWHRRNILPAQTTLPTMNLEEHEVSRERMPGGGVAWFGEQASKQRSRSTSSDESFDFLHGSETEAGIRVT